MKNFGSEVGFTVDLQDRVWGQVIFFFNFQEGAGDLFEIREHIQNNSVLKRKPQIARKPHLKPKTSHFENDLKSKDALLMDEECRARLGELERQENLMGELDRKFLQGDITVQGQRQGQENDSESLLPLHRREDGGSGDEDESSLTIFPTTLNQRKSTKIQEKTPPTVLFFREWKEGIRHSPGDCQFHWRAQGSEHQKIIIEYLSMLQTGSTAPRKRLFDVVVVVEKVKLLHIMTHGLEGILATKKPFAERLTRFLWRRKKNEEILSKGSHPHQE
ncbi:hypothetical protein GH733_018276 [Mirounga leonina]|nr:hypothetical protein GH733_018276 [Mirounga leonina]